MKNTQMAAVFFSALIASAGVSALAADTQGSSDKPGMMSQDHMGGGMMQGGMMQGGMSQGRTTSDGGANCGMMDSRMMQHGGMMSGMMRGGMMSGMMQNGMMGRMMGSHTMIPQLPPGNEKLQLKMQAEIMQKVGEIIAKYADQVVIDKSGAQ